ncbi:MAG: hypothetical protein K6E57_08730 [Fibrobacter sp.]|nr:hypothetical protein [Fibrobacter sp.]
MAIHDNLLSGQFCPVEESLIDNSLSATDKIMPLHPGNKRPRVYRAPKKVGLKKKTDA